MQPAVAIYTRISEDRQGKEEGVTRQLHDCQELADRLGLNVVAVEEDNNRSAYSKSAARPAWERLKGLIKTGAISGIVVWHTDRLYRHPSHLEDIIELVETNGLTIYTVTAGEIDLNTPTGRMVARLLGSVARNEVEHKAERQQRAHLELARQGRWHGGPVPIGFRKTEQKGELDLHPQEAAALQESAKRILDGFSLASTAKWFSAETGRHLDARRLRSVLTGPKIAGLRMHIPQDDRDKWAGHRARRTVSGDLPPEVTTYPAQWPAILDEDTWIQVKAVLLDPSRKTNRGRPVKSLLGGLVYCTGCDHVMSRSTTTYHCHTGSGEGACGKVAISSRALEGLIKDAMSARAQRSEGFDIEEPTVTRVAEVDSQTLTTRREEVLDLHAEGIITKAEMIRQLDRLSAKVQAADQARAEGIRQELERRSMIHGAEYWDGLRIALDQMDASKPDEDLLGEARRFISKVITRIEVRPSPAGSKSGSRFNPERVVVDWKKKRAPEALNGASDAI